MDWILKQVQDDKKVKTIPYWSSRTYPSAEALAKAGVQDPLKKTERRPAMRAKRGVVIHCFASLRPPWAACPSA